MVPRGRTSHRCCLSSRGSEGDSRHCVGRLGTGLYPLHGRGGGDDGGSDVSVGVVVVVVVVVMMVSFLQVQASPSGPSLHDAPAVGVRVWSTSFVGGNELRLDLWNPFEGVLFFFSRPATRTGPRRGRMARTWASFVRCGSPIDGSDGFLMGGVTPEGRPHSARQGGSKYSGKYCSTMYLGEGPKETEQIRNETRDPMRKSGPSPRTRQADDWNAKDITTNRHTRDSATLCRPHRRLLSDCRSSCSIANPRQVSRSGQVRGQHSQGPSAYPLGEDG